MLTRQHRGSGSPSGSGSDAGPGPSGVATTRQCAAVLAAAGAIVGAVATLLAPLACVLAAGTLLLVLACVMLRRVRRGACGASATDDDAPTAAGVGTSLAWLLGACPDAVILADFDGSERYRNPLFTEIFGAGPWPDAAGSESEEAPRIADRDAFTAAVRDLYAHPEQAARGEITVLGGGQVRVLGWTSQPVRDACGVVVGRGFLVHDRTQERELAALKGDFLSTVTHELRTPLTSIKGSLQLVLSKGSALTPIERELLDISVKNTERLIRLINDILDVSQLELGKMELGFASVAPGPLVEEAVAGLRAYAAGRDVSIGCEIEPDLPVIEADRDRLIQVLTNLISNAVKFSPVGGRVQVQAARVAGGITIAIRDWGIGIRVADQTRLFQRFQRLRRGGSEEPGTGLGLAISKAIVDRHGGTISVESAEAEGSTFTVFVPLSIRGERAPGPMAAAPEAKPNGRPTVLLVDDDADLGTVLDVSLGEAYRLLRVERGVEALDVARAERPHVILLDVALPDLSGYDVLRILRHSEATRAIPVVMLTVRPDRDLACRLGAAEVVAKPIDIDDLRRTIARMLRVRPAAASLRVALGPLRSRASGALVAAFEAGGHAVFVAHDSWELLHCADRHDADVAVIEAQNGDTTVAFLRGHAATRRLPLVLLTDACARDPVGAGCTPVPSGVADVDLVRAVEQAARQPAG